MLEKRVAALEADMKDVKASLKAIETAVSEIKHLPKASDLARVEKEMAELKGKISMLPTWWQLLVGVIATWGAGAAIVFALNR